MAAPDQNLDALLRGNGMHRTRGGELVGGVYEGKRFCGYTLPSKCKKCVAYYHGEKPDKFKPPELKNTDEANEMRRRVHIVNSLKDDAYREFFKILESYGTDDPMDIDRGEDFNDIVLQAQFATGHKAELPKIKIVKRGAKSKAKVRELSPVPVRGPKGTPEFPLGVGLRRRGGCGCCGGTGMRRGSAMIAGRMRRGSAMIAGALEGGGKYKTCLHYGVGPSGKERCTKFISGAPSEKQVAAQELLAERNREFAAEKEDNPDLTRAEFFAKYRTAKTKPYVSKKERLARALAKVEQLEF